MHINTNIIYIIYIYRYIEVEPNPPSGAKSAQTVKLITNSSFDVLLHLEMKQFSNLIDEAHPQMSGPVVSVGVRVCADLRRLIVHSTVFLQGEE